MLLRNWTYFERSEERSQAFELLSRVGARPARHPAFCAQVSLLLRQLLTWCTNALSGPHADAYDEPLRTVAESLSHLFLAQPLAFLERDTLLHGLVGDAPAAARHRGGFLRALPPLLLWATDASLNGSHPRMGHVGRRRADRSASVADRFARPAPDRMAA